MASDTSKHPQPASPRQRLTVAIVLGTCALAVAGIPAAAAKPDRQEPANQERQGAGNHEQGQPGHEGHGSGNQEQGPKGQEGHGPGNHEQNAEGHRQQGAGTAEPQAPVSHERHAGSHEQAKRESSPQAPKKHEHPASSGQASGAQSSPVRGPRAQAAAASGGPAVSSPPPAPAPIPAIATTSAATTLPQAPGASPPVAAGALHRAAPHSRARRSRHARGRVAGRRLTRNASSSSSVAPVAAATAAPVRAVRVARARAAERDAPTRGRPSPIVTTITKIVGVVPTSVWILVGVLLALALALGARSRLVALRARRLERQRGELLEDVGLLQAALLPLPPPRLGPVGTSAAYRPADGPGAGGDFYDVFALEDGQLAVILGDVSGHGRQALPHTALIRFTLRAYLEAGLTPRSALQTAGAVLERQLGESFATVVAATYHPRDRVLTYACAGHPPPIVLGSKSIAPITACSAPPIGAGMRTGTRQTVVSVPGWSQVCLYTDGVTEARVGPELYGAERLAATLAELGPEATASTLLERVAQDTTARSDDMAACLLRVEGGPGAPKVLVEELELERSETAGDRTERFLLACGVERGELAELTSSAQVVAGRAGAVLLELRLADGPPEVALHRDNVALLHKPHTSPRANVGVSR